MTTYFLKTPAGSYLQSEGQPTQDTCKNLGLGTYDIFRDDGSKKLSYLVTMSRKGNRAVATIRVDPREDLAGAPTINLGRILKSLTIVAKYWSGVNRQIAAIEAELRRRDALLAAITSSDTVSAQEVGNNG